MWVCNVNIGLGWHKPTCEWLETNIISLIITINVSMERDRSLSLWAANLPASKYSIENNTFNS